MEHDGRAVVIVDLDAASASSRTAISASVQ
jgi:hypothetical protein